MNSSLENIGSKLALALSLLTLEPACGAVHQQRQKTAAEVKKVEKIQDISKDISIDNLDVPVSVVPHANKIFQAFADKKSEFPIHGTLQEKFTAAHSSAAAFLTFAAENQEAIITDEFTSEKDGDLGARPIAILKTVPLTDLKGKEFRKMSRWLGYTAHLFEGNIPASHQMREDAIQYLVTKIPEENLGDFGGHPMDKETELLGHIGNGKPDPRAEKIIKTRWKNGIKIKRANLAGDDVRFVKNNSRTTDAIASIKSAQHTKSQAEELPDSEELSWIMLLAARLNMPYDTKVIKILDLNSKAFMLAPRDLVAVAAGYMEFLNESLRSSRLGEAKNISPHKTHYYFTENGCHAVHGALVIFGKYFKEIQKQDPELFNQLQINIPDVIREIMDSSSSNYNRNAMDYLFAGHLLEAITDQQGAAIFTVDGQKLTGRELLKKYQTQIFDEAPKDPAIQLVHYILKQASQPVLDVLYRQHRDPILSVYTVGHSVAGMNAVKEVLAQ